MRPRSFLLAVLAVAAAAFLFLLLRAGQPENFSERKCCPCKSQNVPESGGGDPAEVSISHLFVSTIR